ncbi:hypothetical protein CH380_02960 [Leptospira adleri]|uniref:Uncharacterized protein n=1 Tax=Leptospira adleri TaxID=2023186 RepID=A0A2M9YT33_9LEPT|nr:hypothetical protein CH380_02960 [Leptospira adleri]PJZ60816.1 hypothetical protein CH376_16320 [Leptospira adleri]
MIYRKDSKISDPSNRGSLKKNRRSGQRPLRLKDIWCKYGLYDSEKIQILTFQIVFFLKLNPKIQRSFLRRNRRFLFSKS